MLFSSLRGSPIKSAPANRQIIGIGHARDLAGNRPGGIQVVVHIGLSPDRARRYCRIECRGRKSTSPSGSCALPAPQTGSKVRSLAMN